MKGALDVHRELLARDVPHEVIRLRTPVSRAEELPFALGLDPARCVAVRCYEATARNGRTAFVAVVARTADVADPSSLLDALRAESLRPAAPDVINRETDFAAGLVCPVGLPPGTRLLADTALGVPEVLYAPAGEGGVALGIQARDLLMASGAAVATLTLPAGELLPEPGLAGAELLPAWRRPLRPQGRGLPRGADADVISLDSWPARQARSR